MKGGERKIKKLFVLLLILGLGLTFNTSVSAKTKHSVPAPHTHVCQGPNGTYTADNSVGCEHLCTLPDNSTYWAAAGLECAVLNPSPDLGQMPTPHDHICTLSDGTTYEADDSVACISL